VTTLKTDSTQNIYDRIEEAITQSKANIIRCLHSPYLITQNDKLTKNVLLSDNVIHQRRTLFLKDQRVQIKWIFLKINLLLLIKNYKKTFLTIRVL